MENSNDERNQFVKQDGELTRSLNPSVTPSVLVGFRGAASSSKIPTVLDTSKQTIAVVAGTSLSFETDFAQVSLVFNSQALLGVCRFILKKTRFIRPFLTNSLLENSGKPFKMKLLGCCLQMFPSFSSTYERNQP